MEFLYKDSNPKGKATMKLKQLINGGALAATVLTLGSAQAEPNPYEGIVFCKATILRANEDDPSSISVTLPFTTTSADGRQYTHWNLGKVPAGGVADSWHSEKGPGKFVAHNDGHVGAYIYLTSSHGYDYATFWYENGGARRSAVLNGVEIENKLNAIYGGGMDSIEPLASLQRWRSTDEGDWSYCLAFTRDVTAKIPTWHMLNRSYFGDGVSRYEGGSVDVNAWLDEDERIRFGYHDSYYIGAYMGYLDSGDYMSFDVKFLAPRNNYERTVGFTFRVEAAAFPLWEHDIEVQ